MCNLKRYMGTLLVILPMTLSAYSPAHGPSHKNEHGILGKWDSRIRSNDSGVMLEFSSDGTVKENSDLEKAGRYSLKDNRLTTYVLDAKEGREKQREFDLSLDGDNITMKESTGGPEIHMERICKGGSATTEILGEWFSPNYPGAVRAFPAELPLRFPAFVEFTKEKKLFFRSTPLKIIQGQYELSDGVLVLTFPNEPPAKTKVRISPNLTDIRITTKGPEIPFRRVTGSDCGAQAKPVNNP
jgi:Family of unknown function (DUF5640)